jgi:hypothetical protein
LISGSGNSRSLTRPDALTGRFSPLKVGLGKKLLNIAMAVLLAQAAVLLFPFLAFLFPSFGLRFFVFWIASLRHCV